MVEWLQSLQLDSPRVGRTWDEVVTVKLTWVTGVGKPLPPFCLLPPSPLFIPSLFLQFLRLFLDQTFLHSPPPFHVCINGFCRAF